MPTLEQNIKQLLDTYVLLKVRRTTDNPELHKTIGSMDSPDLIYKKGRYREVLAFIDQLERIVNESAPVISEEDFRDQIVLGIVHRSPEVLLNIPDDKVDRALRGLYRLADRLIAARSYKEQL